MEGGASGDSIPSHQPSGRTVQTSLVWRRTLERAIAEAAPKQDKTGLLTIVTDRGAAEHFRCHASSIPGMFAGPGLLVADAAAELLRDLPPHLSDLRDVMSLVAPSPKWDMEDNLAECALACWSAASAIANSHLPEAAEVIDPHTGAPILYVLNGPMRRFLRVPDAELTSHMEQRGMVHPCMVGLHTASTASAVAACMAPAGSAAQRTLGSEVVGHIQAHVRTGLAACFRAWIHCMRSATPLFASTSTVLHFALGDGSVRTARTNICFHNVSGQRPGNFPLRLVQLEPRQGGGPRGGACVLAAPMPASWAALEAAAAADCEGGGRLFRRTGAGTGSAASQTGSDSGASLEARRGGAKWAFRIPGDSGSEDSSTAPRHRPAHTPALAMAATVPVSGPATWQPHAAQAAAGAESSSAQASAMAAMLKGFATAQEAQRRQQDRGTKRSSSGMPLAPALVPGDGGCEDDDTSGPTEDLERSSKIAREEAVDVTG